MLDDAVVLIQGDLAASLHRAIPFLKSKALRDKVRGYIAEGRVAYTDLKRLSKLLAADRRAKDLLVADFDRTLEKAVFKFPEKPMVVDRTPEARAYRRMIGEAELEEAEAADALIRTLTPYLNLLLSMFGAGAAIFLICRHMLGAMLETSIIAAVISSFLFSIVELYYIMRF